MTPKRTSSLFSKQSAVFGKYEGDRTLAGLQNALAAVIHGQVEEPWSSNLWSTVRLSDRILSERGSAQSQLFQEIWVLFELGDARDGFFVDFGACDGELLSNSAVLERSFGWSGILAEPNLVFHDALARNRSAAIDHRCVAAESGRTVSFRATAEPEYSAQTDYAFSDLHGQERRSEGFEEYDVETVSLAGLLADHGAPRRIDYLSLDTEGSEYDILKAFDFDAYDVRLITVEHNWTRNRARIHKLLTRHGFVRKFPGLSRWDDWYVKTGA